LDCVTPFAPRLRAGLLVALFFTGALGIPLADGAMFHLAGRDPFAGVTHFEPPGATHHADRCALAPPQAPSQSPSRVDGAVFALLAPDAAAVLEPVEAPRSTDVTHLPRSRAPPHTA
jgi:hypothetical protein